MQPQSETSTPSFPPPTLPPLPTPQKQLHPLTPLLLIITLLALTTSAFLYFQNTKLTQQISSTPIIIEVTPTPTPEAPISTSSATASPSATYTCPANGWVDCMPSPDTTKPGCTASAQSWYKANCLGFQGYAY